MAAAQTRLYKAITQHRVREELEDMKWTADGTTDPVSGREKTARLSNTMMQARKLCCHPYLFGEPLRKTREAHTDERLVTTCGKLVVLDKLLKLLHGAGHRVLIFSQFVKVLTILEDYFVMRAPEFGENCAVVYHGEMNIDEKEAAVTSFQGDDSGKLFAFLASTRSGGLGMNLTAADTVIFYDGDWNPHGDAQAQDRVHRFGQESVRTV